MKITHHLFLFIATVLTSSLFVAANAWAGLDPQSKCQLGRMKAAGKYHACIFKAEAKGIVKGDFSGLQKCEDKFRAKWQQLDEKLPCSPAIDDFAIHAFIAGRTHDIGAALAGSAAIVGGSTWFLANFGESCSARCAALGASYQEETRTFAGSDGNNTNCGILLDAFAAPAGPVTAMACAAPEDGTGCFYVLGAGRFRCTDPTTAAGSSTFGSRACACQ